MQRQWIGKNVKLPLLSEYIEEFLRARDFETSKKELKNEYRISGTLQNSHGSTGVTVRIYGNPNDFVLELVPMEVARLSKMFGSITTLLGGGTLFLRGLRSEEVFGKLEGEFWLFVEETVARLVGSAKD